MIYYKDYILKDVSIMYRYKKHNDKENIKEDIKELMKEGRYYKVLKRMFSLNPNIKYIDFFNSPIGKLYSITENLKLLEENKNILDHTLIKNNLVRIGYNHNCNIKNEIEKNQFLYNIKSMDLLQHHD